jgi:hypothetical protein
MEILLAASLACSTFFAYTDLIEEEVLSFNDLYFKNNILITQGTGIDYPMLGFFYQYDKIDLISKTREEVAFIEIPWAFDLLDPSYAFYVEAGWGLNVIRLKNLQSNANLLEIGFIQEDPNTPVTAAFLTSNDRNKPSLFTKSGKEMEVFDISNPAEITHATVNISLPSSIDDNYNLIQVCRSPVDPVLYFRFRKLGTENYSIVRFTPNSSQTEIYQSNVSNLIYLKILDDGTLAYLIEQPDLSNTIEFKSPVAGWPNVITFPNTMDLRSFDLDLESNRMFVTDFNSSAVWEVYHKEVQVKTTTWGEIKNGTK